MKKDTYTISLRIKHPFINPDDITNNLGMEPNLVHFVDQPRTTPKGRLLEGVYKESYWNKKLDSNGKENLSELISFANEQVIDCLDFFNEIVQSGGDIEYFIGCFVDGNVGDILDWKLLSQCAELKINLAFDIYDSK